MADADAVVGIDIGGTSIEIALVSGNGAIRHLEEHETRQFHGSEDLLSFVGKRARAIARKSRKKISVVGVGVPGTVDANGYLDFAPNLPGVWHDVDVRSLVCKSSGFLAYPINDANAAALGEFSFGAGKKVNSLVLLTLGTGIGGGIVLDGKLLLGAHGRAAEIGHTTIDMNGPRCGCGNRGCLESLAAIPAILTRTFEKLQAGRGSLLIDLVQGVYSEIDREQIGHLLKEAAVRKDAVALEVIAETAAYIGAAIESLVMILDPEMVILGGGIAKIGDPLLLPVRRAVAARTPEIPFDTCKIVLSSLKHGGVVGSAAWALDRIRS